MLIFGNILIISTKSLVEFQTSFIIYTYVVILNNYTEIITYFIK